MLLSALMFASNYMVCEEDPGKLPYLIQFLRYVCSLFKVVGEGFIGDWQVSKTETD